LEHLALDWLDADVAPAEARSLGRRERLVVQTADAALIGRLLAEPGADPNVAIVWDTTGATDHEQSGAFHNTALCEAALYGRLETVRLLLEGGADPSRTNGNGITPLILAAVNGHLDVLGLLLARGAAVDATDADGFTAFHSTCYSNQPECMEALIQAGCDVGFINCDGRTGQEMAEARVGLGRIVALYFRSSTLYRNR
jgi:hypothetical protein